MILIEHLCLNKSYKKSRKCVLKLYISAATTVNFEQSTYSAYEADGSVHPVLVLSNPTSSIVLRVLAGEH